MTDDVQPRFEFVAEPVNLAAARNVVRGVLAANGWAARELDVNIAVGEVTQNIIRYAFAETDGSFWLEFNFVGSELTITVDDNAAPSDPESWSADHREAHEGGHGLKLVNELTTKVTFEPLAAGNRATLCFAK